MARHRKPRRKEHYYRSAKKHGYRARSAYKLRQIAKRYKLLSNVDVVLELCSSPGGWTQVLRELDDKLEIVAVDISPMRPIRGVKFIQGDITKSETLEEIKQATGGSVDLVLSDCSPKVSGNWDLDVARQLFLAEATVDLANKLLRKKGKVLTKLFQGKGFQQFLQSVRSSYHSTKLVKPPASRKSSAEIYLLATGPKSDASE